MYAIRVKNLSRELSGVDAVQDISFDVSFGKILGLLGPNGAGKTTTLRILAGLLAPTSGYIEICGKKIPDELMEVRRRVGFLTYGMKLYSGFSLLENLKFFGQLRQLNRGTLTSRIDRLVEELGLAPFCKKRFEKLSSGEQQRATIANTLLHDPEVLILDEITLSLDVISSAFIIEFIKRERNRGKCILFSTHVMSEAEFLCDEIALIFKGRLIDHGSSHDLIARHNAQNLTAAFLASVQKAKNAA